MTYYPPPICARCGQLYYACGGSTGGAGICIHTGTRVYNIDQEHAVRIQARYAFGKLHNPDHDETRYTDPGFIPDRSSGPRLTEP